jgi:hypothetical protein
MTKALKRALGYAGLAQERSTIWHMNTGLPRFLVDQIRQLRRPGSEYGPR